MQRLISRILRVKREEKKEKKRQVPKLYVPHAAARRLTCPLCPPPHCGLTLAEHALGCGHHFSPVSGQFIP